MEEVLLGYKIDVFNPKLLTISYIKEHLSELNIEEITIDGSLIISDKKCIYSDYENPLVLIDSLLGPKTLSIDSKYYQEHKEEIDELIEFICRYKKGNFIALADSVLVNDQLCTAIRNNQNIERVRLGCMSDPVLLTQNEYNLLKNGKITEIMSYGVSEELKENFDPIILYNRRELVGNFNYEKLRNNETFCFNKILSNEELYYLKYINKKANIDLQSNNYENYFKVIKRLKEVNYEGIINLCIDNKNEFNNYLFQHLDELTDTNNINIKSNKHGYLYCDIVKYMKNERRLIDMILPAMNLSPFEKYLFAYNKVKKFKKYKDSEDKDQARKLYDLLDNDYIVCVGFSNLLADLLDKLGIPSIDYSVSVDVGFDDVPFNTLVLPDKVISSRTGTERDVIIEREDHARREVHLVDPKYGIDGYFLTDPTWDNDLKFDTYNYALMTHDEYVGIRRYSYLSYYGVDELFFIHSLEEFYAKINILLNKNKNRKEEDIIRELLNKFKDLDNDFYQELVSKYPNIGNISFDCTKENIQNIFLDMGEHILTKVNKMVNGRTLKEGITTYYHVILGLEGEELENKVREVIEYNKKLQEKRFPVRYKIDQNDEKTVLLNGTNKFDIDEDEMELK